MNNELFLTGRPSVDKPWEKGCSYFAKHQKKNLLMGVKAEKDK